MGEPALNHIAQHLQYANEKFKELFQLVRNNPKNTVFIIVGVAIIVKPSLVTIPALSALGLSPGGPVSATAAPAIMSILGPVEAGCWFATLQSARMSGYGAPIVAGITRAAVMLSLAAVELKQRKRREGPRL